MNDITAGLLHEIELKSNRLTGRVALALAALGLLILIIDVTIGNVMPNKLYSVIFIFSMCLLLLLCFVSEAVGYDRPWLKPLLIHGISVTVIAIMGLSAYGGWVYATVPVLLSGRYRDKDFVIITTAITGICAATGQILAIGSFSVHIILELCFLVLVAFLSCSAAKEGREMLMKQAELMKIQTETEVAEAEKDAEMADNRNRLMRSQMQPHFLFNCLATIGAVSRRDGQKAYQAISDFADYLRLNLGSLTKEEAVPFREELEHTEKYLKLEKMRFGDNLDVRYNIKLESFGVPLITLQPIVENAILHGMCRDDEQKWVSITSEMAGNYAVITVADNGLGFDTEILKDEKYAFKGLENIKKRLRNIVDGTLEVESKPGKGTVVTIRIPLEQEL